MSASGRKHNLRECDYRLLVMQAFSDCTNIVIKWEACRKLLKSLHREYTSEAPCMIQAAMLCREKNLKAATQYLEVIKSFIKFHHETI